MRTISIQPANTSLLFVLVTGVCILLSFPACGPKHPVAEHELLAGSRLFRSVLILARSADPAVRTEAEDSFRDVLEDTRTGSAVSLSLFRPEGGYTESEIRSTLSGRAIDGVILFRRISSDRDAAVHAGAFAQLADAVNYSAHPGPGSASTGEYEVSLVDVRSGRTVWLSTASAGPRASGTRGIVTPIAAAAIQQMQEAGLLAKQPKGRLFRSRRSQ